MAKIVLTEYPRMSMQRDSYLSLNGKWEYAIRQNGAIPEHFDGKINVPFSPESPLSGVKRHVGPRDYLFYKKVFTLPEGFVNDKTFIHFGAVDQVCKVYLNDVLVGTNTGGFLPFSLDISGALVARDNVLIVVVQDFTDTKYHSRGKQKLKHGTIWYTPQSGIFMPVWIESVPADFISRLKITPNFDESSVEIIVFSDSAKDATLTFEGNNYNVMPNKPFVLNVPHKTAWSPQNPHLYPFCVQLGTDVVTSYFALRKVHVGTDDEGIKRIYLNNEIIFQSGLLDQGYFHEGYLTPPDEETLVNDIKLAKRMGFNVLRKHIKLEWERFYYHCDKLGMLVWQDFVNGGRHYKFSVVNIPAVIPLRLNDHRYRRFGRQDKAGRNNFYEEVKRTIDYLYNYPSIILWTVFNEGWGQFDAAKLLPYVKALDTSRLIDITSGWHDQRIGDLHSLHVYFRPYKFVKDKWDRAVILSEFGGYSMRIEEHAFTSKNFGYRKFNSKYDLTTAFINLYEKEIIPAVPKGLCAAIYTQVSDVEDELNGLVTYDRKVVKIDVDIVAAINKKLIG